MSSKAIIEKTDIPEFIDSLRKSRLEVIAPVKDDVGVIFRKIEKGSEMTQNYINATYSPKEFFLPYDETLFEYRKRGRCFLLDDKIKVKRRVIIGIRPCDVHALLVLDKLFIDDLGDPYYIEKRKKSTIIAINCNETGENCFCGSMGTDTLESGFDILLTDLGDRYYAESGSDIGKGLMKSNLFRPTRLRPKRKKLIYKKKIDVKDIEKRLLGKFDDKQWEKVGRKCLSCGACTLVCPTCYCFNVNDLPDYQGGGKRKRVSSYCMLLEFSKVAGGGVFRKDRTERCKQFVYHKLSYFKEKFGEQLCVGCGRCVDICPVDIDFFETAQKILRGKK